MIYYAISEYLRNVRRFASLYEWFIENRNFILPDEDTPYLIPDVEVGVTPKVEIYSDNGVKLYRYMPRTEKQYETPLLIVYALINKPYILDLHPERSVVRKFLDAGFDVYLIKWGDATIADQFGLSGYIDIFMYDFIEYLKDYAGVEKISILGYCMGGGLSAIYTSLYPENVKNLLLLAATLYFDKEVGGLVTLSDKRFFDPEEIAKVYAYIPAWFMAERFKLLRPLENYFTKYVSMFLNAENKDFLDLFFRMEKWIHDGVNVAPYVYVEYVRELYQNNALCEGKLFINGKKVDPKRIDMPVAAIVGKRDHLAPPKNTLGFLDYISSKDKAVFEADAGHVGLVVSGKAMKMWDEVVKWLSKRSGKKVERKI
ncbi:Poly-beta-hydroxybutyrate polymerase domain protein [Ferroglobus placidus DSM 10642]|uniref:Poly-beta-hydroxybutyrate polymerase domain protein n=1 Tax=Ferroglobus placidus (strain DSM 10642 / AEDII12DO) TaxID=589924 RepID=D3RYK6_FERPA|nr:alpha/beta fold hydrolase [Ferroglobus placidus]ADC65569.1 Poly-beta-hydroxybutyrate polymerase domain protein [Ferroglobus placidus DSM 10642]